MRRERNEKKTNGGVSLLVSVNAARLNPCCFSERRKLHFACTQGRAQPHFLNPSQFVNYKQLHVCSEQYPSNRMSKFD